MKHSLYSGFLSCSLLYCQFVWTLYSYIHLQNYDKSLVQALYSHIHTGRLEEAIDLCRKAHQPWRAASICESWLFSWRAICMFFFFPPLLCWWEWKLVSSYGKTWWRHNGCWRYRNMVWQPQVEIMEIDICTCSTQCTSTALPIFHHPSNHVLTSYTQSSLPNQECVLYTSLIPSLQTSTVLKSAC